MLRLTAAVSALACLLAVLAGTAARVEAGPTAAHRASAVDRVSPQVRYQRQAHRATNKQRTAIGLIALRRQDCVQRFAIRQAKAMAAREEMYHQQLQPILDKCGLSATGENVAYGFATGRVVVTQGWMKSAGHRANILNPVYRVMGIGARKGDDGLWYVSQVFGTPA